MRDQIYIAYVYLVCGPLFGPLGNEHRIDCHWRNINTEISPDLSFNYFSGCSRDSRHFGGGEGESVEARNQLEAQDSI